MGAELLPKPFLSTRSAIASYSFEDFASGMSYVKFYVTQGYQTGAYTYFLTSNIGDAHNTTVSQTGAGSVEKNFDITFIRPAVIAAGDCVINYSVMSNNVAGVLSSVSVEVFHVAVDTTETSIGAQTTGAAAGQNSLNRNLIKIPLTETKFSKGEKLRIEVILTVSGAGGEIGWYYTDPTEIDAAGVGKSTDFVVFVPFKVNE